MNFDLTQINWVAVIAAAVVNMVLGFIWYSPALFAKKWVVLTGKKMEEMKGAPVGYAAAALASLVIAFVLVWLSEALVVEGPIQGAILGLMLGVGFIATTFGANYLFEGRPRDLYLINAGYPIVSLVLMGLVIGLL